MSSAAAPVDSFFDANSVDLSFDANSVDSGFLLHRDLHNRPARVLRTGGNLIYLDDGSAIFDGSAGAAVSCLGHGNQEVKAAMMAQMDEASYVNTTLFDVSSPDALAKELIAGTDFQMSEAFILSSGISPLTTSQ